MVKIKLKKQTHASTTLYPNNLTPFTPLLESQKYSGIIQNTVLERFTEAEPASL